MGLSRIIDFSDGRMQQIRIDPLWDEGISTFLLGEYERAQAPLSIYDLQGFANDRAVRIEWEHTNLEGVVQELDVLALDELYAKGRLVPEDLIDFEGYWSPVRK